jgi:hypothetical protein
MQKTVLHLLLKKISQGDSSAKTKIVPKLAERLVIVPSVKMKNIGTETKVSVITIKESDRSLIPIFTSMPLLKSWLEKNEIEGEGLSINCADICLALGGNRWIMIDPGTDYWCEIEPEYVQKIADFQVEEDDFFDEEPSFVEPKKPELAPINKTIEVPIVPKEIVKAVSLNPESDVKSYPRLRQKTDEDVRATMDLTSLKKKFST